MEDKIIQKWLDDKIITEEQSVKMLASLKESKTENRSNRIIYALSSIGALFFGLGAIFFMASNWDTMPDFLKTSILFAVTFGFFAAGYILKYLKANLPKVGYSLIFLSTILFGVSLMLLAQIYNVNADNHTLILFWIIGILPVAYGFRHQLTAYLSAVLFYIWLITYLVEVLDNVSRGNEQIGYLVITILISASVLMLKFADVHHLTTRFRELASAYTNVGIIVGLGTLFVTTFDIYPNDYILSTYTGLNVLNLLPVNLAVMIVFLLIAGFTSVGFAGAYYYLKVKDMPMAVLNGVLILVLIVAMLVGFVPASLANIVWVTNSLFLFGTLFWIWLGYQKENSAYINFGYLILFIFLMAKYFDFFWELFDRFIFFTIAGLILLAGGIWLEKNRKAINAKFHTKDE